jgi:hypothetical protein
MEALVTDLDAPSRHRNGRIKVGAVAPAQLKDGFCEMAGKKIDLRTQDLSLSPNSVMRRYVTLMAYIASSVLERRLSLAQRRLL